MGSLKEPDEVVLELDHLKRNPTDRHVHDLENRDYGYFSAGTSSTRINMSMNAGIPSVMVK